MAKWLKLFRNNTYFSNTAFLPTLNLGQQSYHMLSRDEIVVMQSLCNSKSFALLVSRVVGLFYFLPAHIKQTIYLTDKWRELLCKN